ncbi:MAG: preprotein translocase subunit SecE [Acidobacteria bacterium]|nr:preprotein translocase subunit SecE [Acidobacteriota bacterium]MBK8149961.1 preprotein translocase subunit SecE [Acidobacteriota bacterium]MBK8810513.1 preprotein translocase subunit SecE [Acidobacteriota bacterium]
MSEAVDTIDNKEGVGEFIRKTRGELDKTSFPSSEDVKNTVIIVIINVIFFAVYLFLVDWAWIYILGDKTHDTGLTWLVNKIAGF